MGKVFTDSEITELQKKGHKTIEEFKKQSRKIYEQRKLLKFLMDNNPAGVVCHKNGEITYVNEALWRMLGYGDYTEILGEDIRELIHPEDNKEIESELRALYRGHVLMGAKKKKIVSATGELIPVMVKYFVQKPLVNKEVYQFVIDLR